MFDNLTLTKERMILCDHNTITEGEGGLNYYFYHITTSSGKDYYAIEVVDGDSSELAVVGNEFGAAKELYSRVRDGRVSTLTLDDIIRDVKMSKKY